MRIKTCIVVLLTALLVMSASSAEELTVSGRVNAVMYADKALEEHFGITLLLQDYFLRTVEEKEDNVFIVRYEGIENVKTGTTSKDYLKISYAGGEILYVVPTAYLQRVAEELALQGAAALNLLLHAHVDLLPESGHAAHARGMGLAHRLLHFLRAGVDYECGTLGDAQYLPAFLEDMREGQEVEHAVLVGHGHALVVGLHGGIILTHGQDDTLRVARRAAGIEDVGNVVHGGLGLQLRHPRLIISSLAQFQEVIKRHRRGIFRLQMHGRVVDDEAFQRAARGEDAACLVVLLLLTHEEEAYLSVVNDELYLLLRTSSVEGDGDGTNAPGPKVGEEILHAVLREHSHVLLHADAQLEHGTRHLTDDIIELSPGARLPQFATEILVDESLTVAILGGHIVNKTRQMTVDLHGTDFLIIRGKDKNNL